MAKRGVGALVPLGVGTLLLLAASAMTSTVSRADDGSWTIINPTGPGPKVEHMSAYDPVGDRMFIFGDVYPSGGGAETWMLLFQPSPHWQQLSSVQNPSGRSSGSMVYDPNGQRILLFGGYDGNYRNDVWELRLGASPSWAPITTQGTAPPPRHWAAGVFDPVGNRFIIIGGYQGGPTFSDVWALNLSGTPTWEELHPQGLVFSQTYGHSAVYDPNGDRVLVWGSTGLWDLDLRPTTAWSRPSLSGGSGPPPNAAFGAVVFDPVGNRMMTLGGYTGATQPLTPWELALSPSRSWRQWQTTGTTPTPRYVFTGVRRANSVVVFGGRGAQGTEVGILTWGALPDVQMASLQNPISCGTSAPLIVSVSPSAATGNVSIVESNQVLASAALQGGGATFNLPGLGVATHSLTAFYSGDASYHSAVSAPLAQVVTATPTSVTCTSHSPTVGFAQSVQFDATVVPSVATGVVDFIANGGPASFASATLVAGLATVTYGGLPAGTTTITARYRGDGCYASFISPPIDQIVTKAVTALTLSVSPNPVIAGFSVSMVSTMTPPSATGLISFTDDTGALGADTLRLGIATLSVTTLAVGLRTIHASYGGDANHEPATSVTVTIEVSSPNPEIVSVRDVKFDQGGRVTLTWRCHIDQPGFRIVTGYRIWRRAPDALVMAQKGMSTMGVDGGGLHLLRTQGANGVQEAFWEALATLPAEGLVSYAYTAATLQDSMPDQNPYTAYLVSALTSDPFMTYQSNPDSGYSVDNFPPVAPTPLVATYGSGVTALHWNASSEADFWQYRVYRGAAAAFELDPAHLVSTQSDTGYADQGPGGAFYKVVAVDVHGGVSQAATVSLTSLLAVPSAGAISLALDQVRPNPAINGAATVEFVLTDNAGATLDVVDVAGRVIESNEVGALGAGRHMIRLRSDSALPAGIRFVRLRQEGRTIIRKFTTIR